VVKPENPAGQEEWCTENNNRATFIHNLNHLIYLILDT